MINVYGYFFMVVMALCVLLEKSQICLWAHVRRIKPEVTEANFCVFIFKVIVSCRTGPFTLLLTLQSLVTKNPKKHEVSSVILEAPEADLEF